MTVRGDYSTPSILDALREEPKLEELGIVSEAAANEYSKNGIDHPFSQEELLEAWRTFVGKIDAPQLKSALGTREPSLTGAWLIEYELDTELQFHRLTMELKPKLLSYLRNQFGNEAIEIQFKVSSNAAHQSNIPYTDAERWSSLVERYPALAALKSKFGLDFEHF
ncbi:MAG: hypothetical protein NTY07_11790 [Bacteroidia bacterium]|nr:hypothetical protein [Bacteroidia bacterium]